MILLTALAISLGASVDVQVGDARRPISPEIYGMNLGTQAQVGRMGVTVRRFGGNQFSRYNFNINMSNEGGDGYWFRNFPLDGGIEEFLATSHAANTASLVEFPLLGYVAKPGSASATPWTCAYSVSKFGPQVSVAPDDANCGNGMLPDGGRAAADPADTSIATDNAFLVAYANRLADAGVQYVQMGNQPALWSRTHVDVHPSPSSYSEILTKFSDASAIVKGANPNARTLGPAEWGWINYFDSAAHDQQNVGLDFVSYYLRETKKLETQRGSRQLDYLDLHVYPQAREDGDTGRIASNDISTATSDLRLRSTRILWDPTYNVESWEDCCIDAKQRIIPRMRDWIAAQYPGTKIAISSYYWGAPAHISGALAEADVLGIFGREGVDLASLEAPPADGAIVEDAFKLYRNYDGTGGRFGSTSIRANSDDLRVASFAAHEGNRLWVVLINKDRTTSLPADVALGGVPANGTFRAFGFSGTSRLASLGTASYSGGHVSRNLDSWSAEILEVSPAGWDGGFMVLDAGMGGGAGGGGGSSGGAGGGSAGGSSGGGQAGGSAGGSSGGGQAGGTTGTGGGEVAAGGGSAGGSSTGGSGGGGGKSGCGCNSTATPLLLLALVWIRRREARKAHSA